VLQICARVCRERGAPLIVGAGGNDTARSAAAVAALADYPEVCAALTVVPYYSRPGEAGVIEHVRALADGGPVPLVIYNIPYRTGQVLTWAAISRIAALPGVAGIKHATGAVDRDTMLMMAARPDDFRVLAGDDLYVSPLLALGADGAILASAHVCTAEFARLVTMWRDGRAAEARALGHRLAPLSAALFAEPNPAVIKAVLHRSGQIPSPAVRLPLLPATDSVTDAAERLAA
jgi:4-hydroxy-tetrahydrodipicolinate synthase